MAPIITIILVVCAVIITYNVIKMRKNNEKGQKDKNNHTKNNPKIEIQSDAQSGNKENNDI